MTSDKSSVNVYREDKSMWVFYETDDIGKLNYDRDTFEKLSLLERKLFFKRRLKELVTFLKILKKNNLFLVSKIIINASKEKNVNREINVDEIIEYLLKYVSWGSSISFKGETWIYRNETSELVTGIFHIFLDLFINNITLENYSDCWIPGIINSGMSISEAQLNSNRLETCLREIKEKCNFFKIEPDEDEEDLDNHLYQKGFRMYVSEKWIEEEDFNKFPNKSIEDFSQFIWEYKNR